MNEKTMLLEKGTYKVFLEMMKAFYVNGYDSHDKSLYSKVITEIDINNCFKIYNANHQRKKRNANDIAMWCFAIEKIPWFKEYKIIFGTLNFNDEAFKTTTQTTRRRMVARYLKPTAQNYIANIDFGEKNEREHYHFIAFTKNNFDIHEWKYGGGKFLRVPINAKDIKKTKEYVLKLTNHASKLTTKLSRVIKDRNNLLEKTVNLLFFEEFKEYKITTLKI